MIYLASPYSHPDAAIRQRRFEAVCRVAARLLRQGRTVYSPIVYGHALCAYGVPGDWRFWQRHDRPLLEACDEVVVLMLDGWENSVGVHAEIAFAREMGKPVSFMTARGERRRALTPA
jgi:hypothetical protein